RTALAKNARVPVAWTGSTKAEPKAPGGVTPMIYTRLNDAGTAFEPERSLITSAVGLDGGGSVAADDSGNVYVAWHAPEPQTRGEANRRVWVARSTDEAKPSVGENRGTASRRAVAAAAACGPLP